MRTVKERAKQTTLTSNGITAPDSRTKSAQLGASSNFA